jgi:hypothetical protein
MLRIAVLSLGAALYVTSAQAHSVHAGCAPGPYHSGNGPHYHPGAHGVAIPCGGGGHYYAPRRRGDYYYQGEQRRRYRQNDDYVGPYYRPYR